MQLRKVVIVWGGVRKEKSILANLPDEEIYRQVFEAGAKVAARHSISREDYRRGVQITVGKTLEDHFR